jgi:tetratricopeptide (TPR) repeat protein
MFKRPLNLFPNKLIREPAKLMKERWIADFSKPERSCFDIKSEISYNAYLDKGSLFLGLKKKNRMAWLETANRVYVNQIINASFHFTCPGGYCAAGIMFRIADSGNYYLALVSSKGYFRLDVVNNKVPRPLTGWTEAPGLDEQGVNLCVIARGDHFIFMLNGRWVAEAHDASIPGGHLGFALVSYDSGDNDPEKEVDSPPHEQPPVMNEGYVCQSWLDFFSVDSNSGAVETEYLKWNGNVEISAESRLRLAESFAALDRFDAAYDQILKAWKQRENAARSVTATFSEMRTRVELIFAARMAYMTGQYQVAEECINESLTLGDDGPEGLEALAEKAKILSSLERHDDLVAFLPGYIKRLETEADDGPQEGNREPRTFGTIVRRPTGSVGVPSLYALYGFACWNLEKYKAAAVAWDKAYKLNSLNGLYAANAANAWDALGRPIEALRRRLTAAKHFLEQKDYNELGALVPKLFAAGKKNHEVHALVAKWAEDTGNTNPFQTALAGTAKARGKSPPKHPAKSEQKPAAPKKVKAKTDKKPVAAKTKPLPSKTSGVKKPAAKTKSKEQVAKNKGR